MSKVRRKHSNTVTSPLVKEIHNPFSDVSQTCYRDRPSKKSPKHSKRSGKCFQLVLICQKLLKPFSSSSKIVQPDISKQERSCKEKSKSAQDINATNRQLPIQSTVSKPTKVDACIQTSRESLPDFCHLMLEDGYDTNHGSDDFPYDVDDSSLKQPYWDLDIDSAIVGDFNSMSTSSLDEQIDPHYATIKMTADGRFIENPQFTAHNSSFANIYPDGKIGYQASCTSSPKSGIYSRIQKPKKIGESLYPTSGSYRLQCGSRMNFDKIMTLRHQLGLSVDLGHNYPSSDSNVCPTDTPDIPLRSYGSSVINYVTKLRQSDSQSHLCIGSSLVCRGNKLSSSNLYSPIWFTERTEMNHTTEILVPPTSEPVHPKRSINKILHHLNPTYHDDSSEDASTLSMTSPSKSQYTYPRDFSDHPCYALDELSRFRHMDMDVVKRSLCDLDKSSVKRHVMGVVNDDPVPWDVMIVSGGDVNLHCDSGDLSLQPLMERSCEEEYFKRDFYHL